MSNRNNSVSSKDSSPAQHSSGEQNVELGTTQLKKSGKKDAEDPGYSHSRRRKNESKKLKTSLKYDKNLQLGRSDFQTILNAWKSEQQLRENIQPIVHPTLYELSQLTLNVGIKKEKRETDDDYEEKLNLPPGWRLLTTASNENCFNGYFGAAFLNSEKNLVVVAHQATRNFGSWYTDFCILFKVKTPRIISAVTFADHVTKALKDVPGLSLSFTGHSLGGYLAQITCFTAKYLEGNHSHFIRSPSEGIQAHTVSFDSPGIQTMLCRLQNCCKLPKDSYKSLDITIYLSVPNIINCHSRQVGNIYRIFPDLATEVDFNHKSPRFALIKLTIHVHLMENIAEVFNEEDWQLKLKNETEWPHISLRKLTTKKAHDFLEQHYSDFLPSSNLN